MITIKPYGGLGNRMRSIDSILAVADQTKVPVKVIWEKTPTLYCDFDQLFRLPAHVNIVSKKGIQLKLVDKTFKLLESLLGIVGLRFPRGYDNCMFEKDILKLKDQEYDFRKFAEYTSVYIETQHRFFSIGKDFELFEPVGQISDRVNTIAGKFSKNTIGVHIRRTDNQKSIDMSPLESFIELIEDAIHRDKETTFFLATDSLQEEQTLMARFKDRIIVQADKKLGRNNPEAIQDALVDMLCLSKTKKILGSYWSSFSETAASIGKIEIEIVTANKIK